MQVTLKRSGGFAFIPGMNRPKKIDVDRLSQQKADKLLRLVQDVDFFNLPDKVGQPHPGAADYHTYTITIKNNGNHKTVRTASPIEDDQLEALVHFIQRA